MTNIIYLFGKDKKSTRDSEDVFFLYRDLIEYLHSQGIAIKVEGEGHLPDVWDGKGDLGTALWYREEIIKAGYTAWMPLVEDKDD